MIIVTPLFLLLLGALLVVLFHEGRYPEIWVSVAVSVGVSSFLLSRFRHRRVGGLMLLLWIVYALPFIHIIPYLTFDFEDEAPLVLWGLAVNPYMVDARVIQLTAMIGAVGAVGIALGVSLSRQIIVRDTGSDTLGRRRRFNSLPMSALLFWAIVGVLISWLTAPRSTVFTAVYTESKSALDGMNFSSAWMVSYVFLIYVYCDAILDQNPARRWLKKAIAYSAVAYVVVFLQLLRGDRESLPLVLSLFLVHRYWAAPVTQKRRSRLSKKRIVLIVLALGSVSILTGTLRSSLADVRDISQLSEVLLQLYESNAINASNLLAGTWSGALLTPLSVAGDHVYGLLPLNLGSDYVNILLSVPPGFIADAVSYARPIDGLSGPAWAMRYGMGGTHATVVPFMNFRMVGVLVIPAVWAYLLTRYEKRALKCLTVRNLALLCAVAMASPHWLWYGEKSGINALIIWALLGVAYRVSLSFGTLGQPPKLHRTAGGLQVVRTVSKRLLPLDSSSDSAGSPC
ncbi:MAG: hypothetical protein JW395_2088 [Nitrospira sp.]|nr:hypothetical protein [Nitrospira sp.]